MAKREKRKLPKGGWGLDYMPAGNTLMPYRLLREHLVRYVFASQFVRGKVVLDVACGSGYGTRHLTSKGASMVVGGDLSQEAIAEARKYYKGNSIELALLDATRLPCRGGSFDVVVSCETLEHIPEYEDFLRECSRVLKDGGTFVCSTPNVQTTGAERARNPYHVNEFSTDELQRLLDGYFKDTRMLAQGLRKAGSIDIKQKLADVVRKRLLWIPHIDKLINLVTQFIFTEFRLMTLRDVEDFDSFLDESCQPIPIESSTLSPINLVAVARK